MKTWGNMSFPSVSVLPDALVLLSSVTQSLKEPRLDSARFPLLPHRIYHALLVFRAEHAVYFNKPVSWHNKELAREREIQNGVLTFSLNSKPVISSDATCVVSSEKSPFGIKTLFFEGITWSVLPLRNPVKNTDSCTVQKI